MACEEAGFGPRIALEAWQTASMVSLVAVGMGVALLPAQVRNSTHPASCIRCSITTPSTSNSRSPWPGIRTGCPRVCNRCCPCWT
ncbi:type 2 periplasmic-binding domain-containing protein [Burkholderia pseudomallei]|uniref:hypothetical protein n=1 Tax=Burkholderia pseudomallei TaxID=28450 RepID=UPI0038783CEE